MALSKEDQEKLRIAKALDVPAALARSAYKPPGGYKDGGGWADTNEVALAGLHRARLMMPKHFNADERAVSTKWLFENGWRVRLA
jgi:hypothetical protein